MSANTSFADQARSREATGTWSLRMGLSRGVATRAPRTLLFSSLAIRVWLGGIVALAYVAAWLGRRSRDLSVWLRAALPVVVVLGVICSTVAAPARTGPGTSVWRVMPWVAGGTLLLTLLAWGLRVRRQISVHEFVAGGAARAQATGHGSRGAADQGLATGLSTLLVVELARLHDLQVAINELSTTFRDAGTPLPRLMTNDAPLLAPADVGDSTMRVGVVTVPLRAIVALVERLARGPRLQGTVFTEENCIALVVQLSGRDAMSWRVDERMRQNSRGHEARLCKLVARVALRIHVDLYLDGGSSGAATDAFVAGLRASREAARGGSDQQRQLAQAERQYLKAVKADRRCGLAFYNLGVDYTSQRRDDEAERAFLDAIERRPDDWRPYYALGLRRVLQARDLLKPTAAEYRRAVESVLDGSKAGRRDAERILCATRREAAGRTLDHDRIRHARSALDEAERLAIRVGSRPCGTRQSRRFQKIRGRYLLGAALHFRGVASGRRDAAGHSIEAARAQAGSIRAGTWLLLRESWRKGTIDVWPREAASDILARLGEAFSQLAENVDTRHRKRPSRCMHACFRAAIRLEPHDAGLLARDAYSTLRLGHDGAVEHGVEQLVTAVSFRPDNPDYRQRLVEAMRRHSAENVPSIAHMEINEHVQTVLKRKNTQPHTLRRLALSLALDGRECTARTALAVADSKSG